MRLRAKWIISTLLITIMMVFVFLFFNSIFIQPNLSMEPGVGKNSLLLVWRFHAGIIKRGDLVVVKVKHPITHESIIILKRVIGLPGETVKIKNGISSIRGVEWIDQYGMVSDFGDSPYIKDDFEVNLLGDEIFVLGDNRRRSIDSRYYGPVKISDIKYYDPVIIWR